MRRNLHSDLLWMKQVFFLIKRLILITNTNIIKTTLSVSCIAKITWYCQQQKLGICIHVRTPVAEFGASVPYGARVPPSIFP